MAEQALHLELEGQGLATGADDQPCHYVCGFDIGAGYVGRALISEAIFYVICGLLTNICGSYKFTPCRICQRSQQLFVIGR